MAANPSPYKVTVYWSATDSFPTEFYANAWLTDSEAQCLTLKQRGRQSTVIPFASILYYQVGPNG